MPSLLTLRHHDPLARRATLVCPACGHHYDADDLHQAAAESDVYDDSTEDNETRCVKCDALFHFTTYASYAWSTQLAPDEEDA